MRTALRSARSSGFILRGIRAARGLEIIQELPITLTSVIEQVIHESPRFLRGLAFVQPSVQATVEKPFVNLGSSLSGEH